MRISQYAFFESLTCLKGNAFIPGRIEYRLNKLKNTHHTN